MSDKEEEKSIAEEIDADDGLKSKRKLLTISSLVLLALSFSSARVEEANTFLLKLTFENQDGLGILLVLGVFFLLIRYYNYAVKYHQILFKEWSDRMLSDDYFQTGDPSANQFEGLVYDLQPEDVVLGADQYRGEEWDIHYARKYFFIKQFQYMWHSNIDDFVLRHYKTVNVGLRHYPKVLLLETKYRFLSFITYREHLDVFAPYLLGGLAIASFFFHDSFQVLINAISAYRQ